MLWLEILFKNKISKDCVSIVAKYLDKNDFEFVRAACDRQYVPDIQFYHGHTLKTEPKIYVFLYQRKYNLLRDLQSIRASGMLIGDRKFAIISHMVEHEDIKCIDFIYSYKCETMFSDYDRYKTSMIKSILSYTNKFKLLSYFVKLYPFDGEIYKYSLHIQVTKYIYNICNSLHIPIPDSIYMFWLQHVASLDQPFIDFVTDYIIPLFEFYYICNIIPVYNTKIISAHNQSSLDILYAWLDNKK